ncbi:DNA (cytosine-5-)-methyltransferase [Kingella kingae]|uniref:DNA (cytosine-5-)-methyltransferase n=1 Tax=Kingella kingae TaxID=504 RepID=UPI0025511162|nr:DNA (cytosine-5-)-methyltransferase [Kingella kingae]MDK4528072.1 DNA (cytosine-5-)-methyltransferase [Kingella kingae]MDK4542709.1 DNA (cytosine-5-)-methyltransferase [Kingella kingae]MDK4562125.1 DNA (cytosine-5-)-methyltransferase [Kingella kingae]MDK4602434.1 DNA (cytosine-5-)-methyltransferase [Kingella kingae]MDK4632342.1 DNA (cytosine-5-)-methyltransferase [Kingella kingae]
MFRVVSLFCGCGGMDKGILGDFHYLGNHYAKLPFEIAYATDHDPYAVKIYNANFSHQAEIKDVRDIVAGELPEHDILLGGFPCQSFSIVAQNPPRLGYKDEKGTLFFEMVKVLKEKKPRFFIAENVKGLLSANQKQAFPMIIREFEQAGYHIHFKLLNASEFGVPQKRERVFIVGFRDDEDFFKFQFPETLPEKIPLKYALDEQANHDEKWFFSQKAVNGMLRVREKMNKGRVQDIEQPCNTISSHLAKVSLNGTDPVLMVGERYRRFSPREAANIQSFPLNFQFDCVSDNRQYRAIGNAVPPVLMWHVVNALVECTK